MAKPIRLAVMLSGGGTTLENICEQIDAGRLDAEVAVVVSTLPCQSSDVTRFCRSASLWSVGRPSLRPDFRCLTARCSS